MTAVRRWLAAHERFVLGVCGILSVLIPWELLVRFGFVKSVLTSTPTDVARTLFREIENGRIWDHIGATAQVWLIGFVLAAVVGISLGLLAGWFKRVSYVANPWLNVLYAAPEIAFVPIFILWFGIGLEFKVWLVFLSAIFFVTINTMAGVHATESRFIEVARTYGANRRRIFTSIIVPGSVPYIMTGLRIGAGRAVVGVVVAEFIASNQGIGFMILLSGQTLNTSRVMVGIVLLAAFGIVVSEILRRLEDRFDAWRPEVSG